MKNFQKRTCYDISLIHQDEFHDFCRNGNSSSFIRNRKMPQKDLLFAIINRKGITLSLELMYTNIQFNRNSKKYYDKDGDFINPRNGLSGLVLTDENAGRQKCIISISESCKDEMFELTKKQFLQENGIHNGDTTKRRDVYDNLYRKTEKNVWLAAGYTMEQYERHSIF